MGPVENLSQIARFFETKNPADHRYCGIFYLTIITYWHFRIVLCAFDGSANGPNIAFLNEAHA